MDTDYKRVCFADSDGGIKLRESKLFPGKEAAEAGLAGRTTSRSQWLWNRSMQGDMHNEPEANKTHKSL